MPVARRAVGTVAANTSAATTLTVAYPTNVVGDVLIMSIASAGTVTTPTGWTLLSSNTATAAHVYVFWRNVSAVLSGSVAVTTSSSTSRGAITSFSGAMQSPPTTVANTSGTGTALTAPSQTYDDFIIWVNARATSSTISAQASSSLLDWDPTEGLDSAGTPSLTQTSGLVSTNTTTSLTGTASTSTAWASVAIGLDSMNIVATEPFTGTTGAAWPAQWNEGATQGTPTIQSNTGQINLAAPIGTGSARMDLDAVPELSELDISTTITFSAQGGYISVGWGDGSGADSRAGNSWEAVFNAAGTASASHVSIGQMIGGVETKAATDVTVTLTAGTAYRVRVQKTGNTLRAKVWTASAAEPTAWTITGTIPTPASLPSVGFAFVGAFQGDSTSRNYTFDDLIVADPNIGGDPIFISQSQGRTPVGAATSATASVTAPTGIVAGNLLVAFAFSAKGNITTNITASSSGWTRVGQLDTGTIGCMAIFTKVATSSEAGPYNFVCTFSSSANQFLIVSVHNYSGVNATTALSATAAFSQYSTATTAPSAPSSTPSTANGTKIAGWGSFNGKNISQQPTGYAKRSAWISDLNMSLITGDKMLVAPAGTATGVATPTGVSDNWIAGTLVLNEQAMSASQTSSGSGSGTGTGSSGTSAAFFPTNLNTYGTGVNTATDSMGAVTSGSSTGTGTTTATATVTITSVNYTTSGSSSGLGMSSALARLGATTSGTASGSGSGSATSSAGLRTAGSSAGVGTVSATATAATFTSGSSQGTGSGNATSSQGTNSSGSSAGTGSLTATTTAAYKASISSAGIGSTSASDTAAFSSTGASSGTGSTSAASSLGQSTSGSSNGTGTSSALASSGVNTAGSSSGVGTTSATSTASLVSAGSSTGTGSTTATDRLQAVSSGSSNGAGSLSATDTLQALSAGSSSGSGTTTASNSAAYASPAASQGVGSTTASVTANFQTSGTALGFGFVTSTDYESAYVDGSSSGTGSTTGSATATFQASGASQGTGSTSAGVRVGLNTAGSSSGTGTTTGTDSAAYQATGSSTGTGSTTATSRLSAFSTGSSTGTGTTSATDTANLTTSGASVGVGTIESGVSAAFDTAGSSAGTGSNSAVVAQGTSTAGSSTGNGTTSATATSLSVSTGSSQGSGVISASVTASVTTNGTSTGAGSSTASATAGRPTSGSSKGTGTTSATDAAALSTAGSSAGVGTIEASATVGQRTSGSSTGSGSTSAEVSRGFSVTAAGYGLGISGFVVTSADYMGEAKTTLSGVSRATVRADFNSDGSSSNEGRATATDSFGTDVEADAFGLGVAAGAVDGGTIVFATSRGEGHVSATVELRGSITDIEPVVQRFDGSLIRAAAEFDTTAATMGGSDIMADGTFIEYDIRVSGSSLIIRLSGSPIWAHLENESITVEASI